MFDLAPVLVSVFGGGGAAITSTRCPPGAIAKARSAPQSRREFST